MIDALRDVHTYPLYGRPHDTDGRVCWCRPLVEMLCPSCDGEESEHCWRCLGREWIECPDPEMYDGAAGLHVVHNEAA